MRRLLKYVVALAIVAGLGVLAYMRFWPSEAIAALGDQTFVAEIAEVEDVLLVTGLVRPAVTIELRAEASGIVEVVAAKEGDRVTAGEGAACPESRACAWPSSASSPRTPATRR